MSLRVLAVVGTAVTVAHAQVNKLPVAYSGDLTGDNEVCDISAFLVVFMLQRTSCPR